MKDLIDSNILRFLISNIQPMTDTINKRVLLKAPVHKTQSVPTIPFVCTAKLIVLCVTAIVENIVLQLYIIVLSYQINLING